MLSVDVSFKGSPADKALAGQLFNALTIVGRFMAFDAPIRLPVADAIDLLGKMGVETSDSAIATAIKKNDAVFSSEKDEDGKLVVLTTRAGRAPLGIEPSKAHTFAERFMKPLPKPEKPEPVARPVVSEPVWTNLDTASAIEETVLAAEATLSGANGDVVEVEEIVVEEILEVEPIPAPRTFTIQPLQITKLDAVDDVAVASAITERLTQDSRVATFGDQWMLEDRVQRLGRNDLRRIREYIQEQEQPLTDDVIAQDVMGGRPGTPEFEQLRFAVNFRLSREHREFDFVGTSNQRFWSVSSLAPLGTSRRKPNEIGTDYRFLVDDSGEAPAHRTRTTVDRVLTFYEFQLGLIPYDAEMAELLPAPLLPNQKSAVLTFECPQSYTTYLVELRYPSPNRGGFIVGLDDFYNENLVPGALVSIGATENDGHYIVKYVPAGAESAKLLELEDRRQRYVFRQGTYACGVMEDQLLTEERFPSLAQEKQMDEKSRRKLDDVIGLAFQRINHPLEGGIGFAATFSELYAVANIERPITENQLRTVLETEESGAFSRDPDIADGYTYVPSGS